MNFLIVSLVNVTTPLGCATRFVSRSTILLRFI